MEIPALLLGEAEHSLEKRCLKGINEIPIANVEHVPGLIIAKTISEQRQTYQRFNVDLLIKIIKEAGNILITEDLNGQSKVDYYHQFVSATGLPVRVAVEGLNVLSKKMQNIDSIIINEVPYQSVTGLDNGVFENNGRYLSAAPYGKILGTILPSNHPGVNISWITALALKYSVVLKPGKDDPFTPYRVVSSLLKAGLPPWLISMIPTDHENISKVIQLCDKTVFYGNRESVNFYESNRIIPRASGNSKIYIDLEQYNKNALIGQMVIQSIIDGGGRRCTNASSIIVKGDATEFAHKLSKQMNFNFLDPHLPEAVLGCFKQPEQAAKINDFIEERMVDAEDVTSKILRNNRLQEQNGYTFLRPTVILCKTANAPLYGQELSFPFVTIVQASNDLDFQLSNSLAVSLFTEDEEIVNQCITNPSISKVIRNAPTFSEEIGDPHDGFLFPNLYKIKSFYQQKLQVS